MMIPPHQFLLVLTALAPTAHSLPQAPTSDLSPIHHVVNLTSTPPATAPASPNGEPHCYTNPSPFERRQKPRFTDCGAAIRELPSNHDIGNFRTGGPADQFRLPVTKEIGTCSVKVNIQPGLTGGVTSTWVAIGMAATQLNMACVNSFTFPIKIGGWTTTGARDGIVVTLRYAGSRDRG
ncbi:hypothetical protein BDR22DRAFT_145536 [Usnea florida]